jgi:hypothetical protein
MALQNYAIVITKGFVLIKLFLSIGLNMTRSSGITISFQNPYIHNEIDDS